MPSSRRQKRRLLLWGFDMAHINAALFVVHEGCPHRCSFCNQRSISGETGRITPQEVCRAAEIAVASNADAVREGEIAFFGGSFTMIERSYMLSLLEAASEYVKKGLFKGIRISTRPDGIDDEICLLLKQYGVTSVELGAQSMSDGVLAANGRGHTAEAVEAASAMLHSYGFELGLQMMTGLYKSTDEDCIETARRFIELCPATVRIYPTAVLRGTRLAQLMQSGEYEPQTVEQAIGLCSRLLLMFHCADIPVIRLGLHSGGGVEGDLIAGAYHPALREKCESRIYRELLSEQLCGRSGEVSVAVNGRELSKFVGQKRENIDYFRERGVRVTPVPVGFLGKYELKVYTQEVTR